MESDERMRRKLESIARKFDLDLILLFGSAVGGELRKDSDLDVAVRFRDRPGDYRRLGELIGEIQELFPEREVDLSVINYADPLFLKKMLLEDCELLFGYPRELAELKIYAYKRYQDHKPFLKMERRYVESFLEGFRG